MLTDPQYADTLISEFDHLIPDLALQFEVLQPRQGMYRFDKADFLIAYARSRAMQVRGHPLISYRHLPAWLTERKWQRAELAKVLDRHVSQVLEHFKDDIQTWDVVGDVIAPNTALRNSVWLRVLGPEYIELAFKAAHWAAPRAKLFLHARHARRTGRRPVWIAACP